LTNSVQPGVTEAGRQGRASDRVRLKLHGPDQASVAVLPLRRATQGRAAAARPAWTCWTGLTGRCGASRKASTP